MKLNVALIIISSVSLFGIIVFYIFANSLKNQIDSLVLAKKRKKKSKSSSRKS